jgi:16S rRNA (uracil1498-N3)-methyltransferase
MKEGNELHVTDGKGNLFTAKIIEAHKKHCTIEMIRHTFSHAPQPEITMAISPLKNHNRFEWFLEKATEIGVNTIVPLICNRTDKQNLRNERLQNILISAMLQSRQVWFPELQHPLLFKDFIASSFNTIQQKYIAHCAEDSKQSLQANEKSTLILIGPEGDFTSEEITMALKNNYIPVTLGNTRLRTETAGIAAAVKLRIQ